MAQRVETTPLGERFVRLLQIAISMDNEVGMAALAHRLPIRISRDRPPVTYTVDLSPDARGNFLAACRELPDVVVYGETEDWALELAEMGILQALGGRS